MHGPAIDGLQRDHLLHVAGHHNVGVMADNDELPDGSLRTQRRYEPFLNRSGRDCVLRLVSNDRQFLCSKRYLLDRQSSKTLSQLREFGRSSARAVLHSQIESTSRPHDSQSRKVVNAAPLERFIHQALLI